jgi:hypothetical protein
MQELKELVSTIEENKEKIKQLQDEMLDTKIQIECNRLVMKISKMVVEKYDNPTIASDILKTFFIKSGV